MNIEEVIKYFEKAATEKEKEAKEWHENQVRKCELFPFTEMDYTHENKCKKNASYCRQLAKWLKEIKQLREQTKWIPVKERLPETDGDYLLFGKIDDFEDEYYKFIGEFDSVAEKFGICRDCFDPNTLGCLGSEFYEYGEVLAWMPLPDDYKEGKESE